MKLLLSIAAILILSACSDGFVVTEDPRSINGINSEFIPYVDIFESMYGKSIGDIPIQFASLEGNIIGMCTRWSSGHRQIEIDKDYWDSASNTNKIGLIFHELGHCRLNRNHVNSLFYHSGTHIAGHIPYSLMYPYNFYSDSYIELQEYYFEEMFNPTNAYSTDYQLASKDDGCVKDVDNFIKEANERFIRFIRCTNCTSY